LFHFKKNNFLLFAARHHRHAGGARRSSFELQQVPACMSKYVRFMDLLGVPADHLVAVGGQNIGGVFVVKPKNGMPTAGTN
jgi:hypothetical protein